MRPARSVPALLVTAAALAAPAGAQAAIELDVGMGGFRLGMTAAEVAQLGAPTSAARDRNANGSARMRLYFGGPRVQVTLLAIRGTFTVTDIATRRGTEKTPQGVGVGTAERNLRARIPGLQCFRIGTTRAPQRSCVTPAGQGQGPPANATFFTVSPKTKQITRIAVTRTSA